MAGVRVGAFGGIGQLRERARELLSACLRV